MSGLKSEESKIILNGAWHLFVRRNHSLTRKKLIGLFGFRCGKTSAEKEYLMKREQENEKAVLVLAEFSGLSRDECLERLHGGNKK